MKIIEIPDDMYNSLMELANEMTTQDMRCTKMPHMFQVKTSEEVAAYEGCGETAWVDSEGEVLRTKEDIKRFITMYLSENDDRLINCEDEKIESEAETIFFEMDEEYREDFLIEKGEFRRIEVTNESKFTNTFLTAKACQEHIESNRHHYGEKARVYLNHAWRNPEMELVSKFLCGLVGKQMHI